MSFLVLFLSGTAFGSFLNVLIVRYDDRRSLFSFKNVRGRSHCPRCKRQLRWYELIPIVSFILLRGRCRSCGKSISIQYPIVEFLAGTIFIAVPLRIERFMGMSLPANAPLLIATSAAWIAILLLLVAVAAIDLQKRIIPDGAVAAILLLGIGTTALKVHLAPSASFLGPYAGLFGLQNNVILGSVLAMAVGVAFFWILFLTSHGKGIGMGDGKLAGALGFALGWPDTLIALMLSFIIGALTMTPFILMRSVTMKNAVPFAPFMAIASAIVFFFGDALLRGYFRMFGII